MRHTVGLYHGQIGSKEWKRYLSDNMMAKDSDFQKYYDFQNNEKANQGKFLMEIISNAEINKSFSCFSCSCRSLDC